MRHPDEVFLAKADGAYPPWRACAVTFLRVRTYVRKLPRLVSLLALAVVLPAAGCVVGERYTYHDVQAEFPISGKTPRSGEMESPGRA